MAEIQARLREALEAIKKDRFSLANREALLGAAINDGPALLGEIARLTSEVERLGKPTTEMWDAWYGNLPADLKKRLSCHDFKRLGDLFKSVLKGNIKCRSLTHG